VLRSCSFESRAKAQGENPAILYVLLGHVSVQTTQRYLGYKQRLRNAVKHHIGSSPTSAG
jgi:site-specific recombinase XerD